MKTELERYKKALAVASGYLSSEVCKRVHDIIHPPIETEDAETERFVLFYEDGTTSIRVYTREEIQGHDANGGTFVRVSRSFTRPKPVPVERSVSVEGAICTAGHLTMTDKALYEFPEARGKRGVLSFAWTE